jgi:hypothetical protein
LALGDCRAIDGALKCAATKAKATANQLQLLPGSMNLNRPLQSQRLGRDSPWDVFDPAEPDG